MEGLGIGRLIETMDSMKATPSCFVLALCVLCFGAPFMGASQSVNKLNVKDFAEELEVSYQLKADRPLTVQLYFSEDDGYTWRGPLKSVSGDVGPGVIPGKRKIIWNFAEEVEELWGERFRFKVKTSEHYGFFDEVPGRVVQCARGDFRGLRGGQGPRVIPAASGAGLEWD